MDEINNTSGTRSNTAQRILTGIVALAITIFALLVFRTQLQLGYDPIGATLARARRRSLSSAGGLRCEVIF